MINEYVQNSRCQFPLNNPLFFVSQKKKKHGLCDGSSIDLLGFRAKAITRFYSELMFHKRFSDNMMLATFQTENPFQYFSEYNNYGGNGEQETQ